MRQWDIFRYPFPSESDPHFVVVISPEAICENAQFAYFNALACQTVRPMTRAAKLNEVYLDRADGFDWKTLVRCEFFHTLEKSRIMGSRKGRVSPARIEEIRTKLRSIF